MQVRPPAVAGMFYPGDSRALDRAVRSLLDEARASRADAPATTAPATTAPKALIVPHAGYVYSGSTAARGYVLLDSSISRVVLLGPSHRVYVEGLALSTATTWRTPLGDVPIERPDLDLPQVLVSDEAHAYEHSLEVQVPFLQRVLDDVTLVPLVVGRATPEQVGDVIDALAGGPETLVLISSDLSHYHPYTDAQRRDRASVDQILTLTGPLSHDQACGATPVNGLLVSAARHHPVPALLALNNSGDTAGDKHRVVGYTSIAWRST